MKVVICGSTNVSCEQIGLAAEFFTKMGNTVITPSTETKNLIDMRLNYLNKVEKADLVVVIPKGSGSVPAKEDLESLLYKIGESTCYEYLYAIKCGIPTVIWDHPNYKSDLNPKVLAKLENKTLA